MNSLGDNLLCKILVYSGADPNKLKQVSKRFNNIVHSEAFWQMHAEQMDKALGTQVWSQRFKIKATTSKMKVLKLYNEILKTIRVLPDEFKEVDLSASRWRRFAEWFEEEASITLRCYAQKTEQLDLTNKINLLPKAINAFTDLTWLNLKGNNLVELPDEIGELPNLISLNLTDNGITRFPKLYTLKKLQILNLSNNELSSIPEKIVELTALQVLDLSNNQLDSLPENFSQLRLFILYLDGNRFKNIPTLLSSVELDEFII